MELQTSASLIDREQAFMLFATFTGDIERTAHALNVRPVEVLRMVDEERWTERLKGILELKKSGRPGDLERAINRALNFVQAHRMRLVVERAIRHFTGLSEAEFTAQLLSASGTPKEGAAQIVKTSTRALADLASALEKVQSMTYQALNDTTQERTRRKEEGSGDAAGEMHAKIALAMSKVGQSNTPRAQLFDAQVRQAEQLVQANARAAAVPYNPNDDDEH